jgi:hypothetical protein
MLLTLAGLISLAVSAQAFGRSPAQQSREQSERLIRTALYETALSSLTGDVKLYRSHIARRTLELNRLVFEGLKEVPDYAEMLTENKLDTADKFLDMMFVQGASQYAKLSRNEMEQRAHAQADGTLTFLNDQEVVLQFGGSTLRIVYEDQGWKVDETEASKKLFLQNFQFKPETRAKIEKL